MVPDRFDYCFRSNCAVPQTVRNPCIIERFCRIFVLLWEKKGKDLNQSYDKSPYTNRNVKRAKWQHKNVTKTFDYTAIADRLRMVNLSNYNCSWLWTVCRLGVYIIHIRLTPFPFLFCFKRTVFTIRRLKREQSNGLFRFYTRGRYFSCL